MKIKMQCLFRSGGRLDNTAKLLGRRAAPQMPARKQKIGALGRIFALLLILIGGISPHACLGRDVGVEADGGSGARSEVPISGRVEAISETDTGSNSMTMPSSDAHVATFNQAGFDLLKRWEGCILHAYDDANGQPVKPGQHVYGTLTIGYGHTGPDVVPGLVWTQAQADQALQNDVAAIAEQIRPLIHVALTDNQFSAMLCLAFNIGVHAFAESSALSAVNGGDLSGVPAFIKQWNKTVAKGHRVVSKGLENRLEAEATLWSTPEEAA